MDPPLDEDADIRTGLAALGPGAVADLRRVLEGPSTHRNGILKAFMARPGSNNLATPIAMADTDETVRLRLLRASGTSAP
jgi:hypothetical protein